MYEIDEFLLNFHLKSLHHLRKTVKQLGKHIKNIIEGRLWLSSSPGWKTEIYQMWGEYSPDSTAKSCTVQENLPWHGLFKDTLESK